LCLKEWLSPYDDGDGGKKAKMRIFSGCRDIIRCLPLLLCDKNRPGDVSTEPHSITHAPDALRYFAVSRPIKPREKSGETKRRLSDELCIKKNGKIKA
ncbi:MAG: hypothetical protein IKI97_10070, partial [Clostridia bacterium]|nr:hypothetical protein [Clostridia bacterium]